MLYQVLQYNDILVKLVISIKNLVCEYVPNNNSPKFAGGYIYSRLGELLLANKFIYNTWLTPRHLLNRDEPVLNKLINDMTSKFRIPVPEFRIRLEKLINEAFSKHVSSSPRQYRLIYQLNNFYLCSNIENKELRLKNVFSPKAVEKIFKLYDEYPNIVGELLVLYSFASTSKAIGLLSTEKITKLTNMNIQICGCPKVFRDNVVSMFHDERGLFPNNGNADKILVFPPYIETIIEAVVVDIIENINNGSEKIYYLIVPKWNDNPYFFREINKHKPYIRYMSYAKSKLLNIKKINGEGTSYGEMYFIAMCRIDKWANHKQVYDTLFNIN